jgi:GT2 family glycosyltransferase
MGETKSRRAPRAASGRAKAPKGRAAPRSPAPTVLRGATLASEFAIVIHQDTGEDGQDERHIDVARVVEDRPPGKGVMLVLGSGRRLELASEAWGELHGDLRSLVREELAPLDAQAREAVLATLARATAQEGGASPELSRALHAIREVLRERLPRCEVDERQPTGLSVEQLLAVDDSSFWIHGWMHDEDGGGAVRVLSPEGARTDIIGSAFRYERPDVVEFYSARGTERTRRHGFTAFFTVTAPSLLPNGWIAELHTGQGVQVEVQCPAVLGDPHAVRSIILGELDAREPLGRTLASEHGRHALTRLQKRIVSESQLESVDLYGQPPPAPAVSIVIPLYKRLDFIEHQLLQFSRDPDFARVELIYVLDSVEQKDELALQARALFALYGVPFKVLNLSAGAGYAGANEHGIAASRAKRLLLLNSDVIPDRPGWLSAMCDFYDATDGIGALGPKLLYEDDSLQHAGLYFHRAPGSGLWENAHCFKGLHRSFPPANVARAVPAVTAACMLIDRDRYERAEGLPLHYVQGDYEDSELCLRLAQAGLANWYLPGVELYHLEGQSYTPDVRRVPSEYNMWLHTELWGERIEEAMEGFDPNATVRRRASRGAA